MYFTSNIFQAFKITITTAGFISALLIFGYGLAAAKTIYVIGGGICLIQSGYLFFDSSKVFLDIKKQILKLKTHIDSFKSENLQLQSNVDRLIKIKDGILEQAIKLDKSVQKGNEQIAKLETLKNNYETLNKDLETNLAKEKTNVINLSNQTAIYQVQNKELEKQTHELITVKTQIETENNGLKNLVIAIKGELAELEHLRDQYLNENTKLQEMVKTDGEQLEVLKSQVAKLKELYDNSKQLLINLATAGDMFDQFQTSIGNSVVNLSSTAQELGTTESGLNQTLTAMKNLLIKLKESTFQKLDTNQDGVITQNEFENNIVNL